MLALGAGYLKFVSASARSAGVAAVESVQAAKDGAVAMLSYTPDTADKSLSAARDLDQLVVGKFEFGR
jgi:Mce-associated membrane protein